MDSEELDIIYNKWMAGSRRRRQVTGELRAFQRPLIDAFENGKKPTIALETIKKYKIMAKDLAEAQEIERIAFIELIDHLMKR